MELRVVIQDGLLSTSTHRMMKMIASYISSKYAIMPDLMDLEGAVWYDIDKSLCTKIVNDVKKRFQLQLKYIDVVCL
jgi:hypothetical protein